MTSPSPAAVVILHRAGNPGKPSEIYWVRRADQLAFLGGFWSFPGGRSEPADATLEHAAARELAEETGVIVPPDVAHFRDAGQTITPDWAPIRFAATYFLVDVPRETEPDPSRSGGELVAGEWVTPEVALSRIASGERLTSPVVARAVAALAGPGDPLERLRQAALSNREHDHLRLWDLAPGLGVISLRTPTLPPATHTNCYVVGGAELIVIDPASPYPEEREALDAALDAQARLGRRVREIWLTHHHVDHVSGAAHLAARLGVPVAAHPLTAALVAPRIQVARLLEDGAIAELPGDAHTPPRRLRAMFTPGHAPGHHCFVEETTGFLIAGDMVAAIGTIVIDADEGDMRAYLDSLARMAALDPRVLLPAHGNAITDPQGKLADYRKHRLMREGLVVAALAKGAASARELVPAVYQDVAPAVYPLAERSLLAHLIKLEKDGRARREGERWLAVT